MEILFDETRQNRRLLLVYSGMVKEKKNTVYIPPIPAVAIEFTEL